jgi:hypothetical protein
LEHGQNPVRSFILSGAPLKSELKRYLASDFSLLRMVVWGLLVRLSSTAAQRRSPDVCCANVFKFEIRSYRIALSGLND